MGAIGTGMRPRVPADMADEMAVAKNCMAGAKAAVTSAGRGGGTPGGSGGGAGAGGTGAGPAANAAAAAAATVGSMRESSYQKQQRPRFTHQ